jgi:uncharacterized protein
MLKSLNITRVCVMSMQYKKYEHKLIVRIDPKEEIIETLKQICKTERIKLGTINGIGATDKAVIGLLNLKTKKYQSQEFIGDHEITSLSGNISMMNGDVYLHIHITLGNAKHESVGGHLLSAVVSVTCELIIEIIDGEIQRKFNDAFGANLLSF